MYETNAMYIQTMKQGSRPISVKLVLEEVEKVYAAAVGLPGITIHTSGIGNVRIDQLINEGIPLGGCSHSDAVNDIRQIRAACRAFADELSIYRRSAR